MLFHTLHDLTPRNQNSLLLFLHDAHAHVCVVSEDGDGASWRLQGGTALCTNKDHDQSVMRTTISRLWGQMLDPRHSLPVLLMLLCEIPRIFCTGVTHDCADIMTDIVCDMVGRAG